MLKFCTLFNTTYLSRGLAMYHSLEQNCPEFHLYILAFDTHCFEVLSNMRLPKVSVISLEAFENEALLEVKPGRTAQEYCWTSASSSIKYCIERFNLYHCTYVSALSIAEQRINIADYNLIPHEINNKMDNQRFRAFSDSIHV